MKVTAVVPGSVSYNRGDNEWIYGYYLHHGKSRKTFILVTGFSRSHEAKQDMRERISNERKRHSIGDKS